jgi:hypothetical protein
VAYRLSQQPGSVRFMKATELYRFYVVDEVTGKPRLTRYRMTREEANERHPGAEPELRSLEIRDLPESPAEFQFNSAWLRKD